MPTHSQDRREVEEVRWVSDKTKIGVGLASALAICGSIIASTWALRGYVADFKSEISDHFARIELSQAHVASDVASVRDSMNAKLTVGQMQVWANQLDKFNRAVQRTDSTTGLLVPDPTTISRP